MAEETTLVTKPSGIKTTEFWLTSLTLAIGALVGTDVIGNTNATGQAIVFVAAALAVVVYTLSRSLSKR